MNSLMDVKLRVMRHNPRHHGVCSETLVPSELVSLTVTQSKRFIERNKTGFQKSYISNRQIAEIC